MDRSETQFLLSSGEKSSQPVGSTTESSSEEPSSSVTSRRGRSAASKEPAASKEAGKSQDGSKEGVDEVSIQGPKKSDGSEFRKGVGGWTKSAVYLLTIWICGGLFTALVMYLLLLQLKERPHYFGRGTHIGGTPHVVFEPNPNRFDVRTKSVISFRSDDPSTYYNLMVRYKHLLTTEYNNTEIISCERIEGVHDGAPTNLSICHLEAGNSEIFGECALTLENINKGMGFGMGQPCIMLRLTRILGWFPEDPIESQQRTCHDGSTQCCNRRRLQFTCRSEEVTIEMMPADGMSTCGYPFWSQPGYEQPFVMMKITGMERGNHEIRCKPSHKSIQSLDDGAENFARIIIQKLD